MPDEEDPIPIQGHIFGKLTPEETGTMMRRALEDQDTFNELWDSAAHRELLQDPAFRDRLLRSLEQPAQRKGRSPLGWLFGSGLRWAMTGAAVALLAFAIFVWTRRGGETDQMLTLVSSPATELSSYFRLPLTNSLLVGMSLPQVPAVYRPGEVIRGRLHLRVPGAVFVLRRDSVGAYRIVFPSDLAVSAELGSGEQTLAFDPVSPTTNITSRQTFTLRVIVLPPGRDLRTQSIDWAAVRNSYSAIELTYDVIP